MKFLRGIVCLVLALCAVSALPDLSNIFDYEEGDRFFVTTDHNGRLRLVDLEEVDLNTRFDAETETTFALYTRANPTESQLVTYNDLESLTNSNYDSSKPTKFYSHGWTGSGKDCRPIKDGYMSALDVNFFCIDWSTGASALYPSSVAYVPRVGNFTGRFIDWLISQGSTVDQFHVIGHSLGGHVAGITGRSVTSGTVPYITALDPAYPLWGPSSERIRPSDGGYVEVIHTNCDQLGLWDPVGHADFYPNGGKLMPGCGLLDPNCSHGRSVLYFAYSIDNNYFMADQCDSIDEISGGNCSSISQMHMGGAQPKSIQGIYTLTTTDIPPFYKT